MGLFDLPSGIPWLSIIWLSLLIPAILVLFLPEDRPDLIRWVGTGASAVSLVLSLLVFLALDPAGGFQFVEQFAWFPQLGISYSLGVDGISAVMLLLNGIIALTAALISWNISERIRQYWAMFLLLTAGAYGVFSSLDLFLLFVFYELTLFPKFLLITLWGSTRKEYGAMKLAMYLMAGSALIILGMVAIYFGSGLQTFDLRILGSSALFPRELQLAVFPVVFVGFGILAGLFPFHTWVPTGHVAAPTAASMLLAGVMMKLGSYGCLRVALWLMPQGAEQWLLPIAILAVIGAVYGATITLVQRDFKFLIGYSSVSHMALTIMGLAAATPIGLTGAVFQMFAHGIMSALLFAVVGRMVYDRTHTRQLSELGGLARSLPYAAVVFTIGSLASMGMPGFASFWAEMNIFLGTWQRFPVVAVIGAISVPITAAYMLRAVYSVFFSPQQKPAEVFPPLTWPEYAAGGLLVVVLVVCGLFPGMLTEPISQSVAPIADSLSTIVVAAR
ncbi:MAG: NADH-quinone oxidoreductase subunit M [Roseiflexaceae bacterium]